MNTSRNIAKMSAAGSGKTYDLCKEGYQAIDIGHTDLMYERLVRNQYDLYTLNVPYKYCNYDERISGRKIEDVTDPNYLSEIVAKII